MGENMNNIFRNLCCVVLLGGLTSVASAADKTWTGQISDSMCGASHDRMITEHAGTSKMTTHDCTLACVKAGGKYVFVINGRVYNIANQQDPDLKTHAGHTVQLTGEMSGDTITVSKVVMPQNKS
jgi:hypothetical protein